MLSHGTVALVAQLFDTRKESTLDLNLPTLDKHTQIMSSGVRLLLHGSSFIWSEPNKAVCHVYYDQHVKQHKYL